METRRLMLHQKFIDILGTQDQAESCVYFDPPASVRMKYDAIKYSRSNISNRFADDRSYSRMSAYEVIFIHRNPDDERINRILELPYCSFDRHYVSDNLHHDVFTIYH